MEHKLAPIKREHIEEAARIIDKDGTPASYTGDYMMVVNGKQYHFKYLTRIAYKLATGVEVDPNFFQSNENYRKKIVELGFEILNKSEAQAVEIYRTAESVGFNLSDDQLKILLTSYSEWLSTRPKEQGYIQGYQDLNNEINETFLNKSYLNKTSDDELIIAIKNYLKKLEGPVGIKLGDKRLRHNLEKLKADFLYIIDTGENPFQVTFDLLEGDKKLENFAKAFWTPILQARFPEIIPNWNNKTENFLNELGIKVNTTKLNTKEKIEKISGAFKYLQSLEPKLDFFHLNHLMHYGVVIEEGKKLMDDMLYNSTTQSSDKVRPLKIYKVSVSASANSELLFSPDNQFFYWNQKMFRKNEIGDPVIFVNKKIGVVLFTEISEKKITSEYDSLSDTTSFTHRGKVFTVDKEFEDFVQFKIIQKEEIPAGWKWTKPIGVGETYGIWEPGINNTQDRIVKVDDLLKIFTSNPTKEILEEYKSVLEGMPIEFIEKEIIQERRFWFVCQGDTFNLKQSNQQLWAPKKSKSGHKLYHWTNVSLVKKGDIIFNYAEGLQGVSVARSDGRDGKNPFSKNNWQDDGYLVDIEFFNFSNLILVKKLIQYKEEFEIRFKEQKGPFDKIGKPIQGYLFEFNYEAAKLVREIYGEPFPDEIESLFEGDVIVEKKSTKLTSFAIIDHICNFCASKGFNYSKQDIANFYLSLKTKPFVILAGISGTGKTKLVELFSQSIGYGDKDHCVIIPVKPDWTDNSDLMGYTNLNKEFEKKKLTEVILAAKNHPNEPYFVILDEMNLARVEHYFSDFLSIIETREIKGEKIISKSLLYSNDVGTKTKNRAELVDIQIPQNLYIVGTVNMDETTFPFSKKVLDRANSIEMNNIDLDFTSKTEPIDSLNEIYNDVLISSKINSSHLTDDDINKLRDKDFIKTLKEVNDILAEADLQFAYRVRDEVAFYMLHSEVLNGVLSWEGALDYQVMQKILPRIQGSAISINYLLIKLINYFMGEKGKFDIKSHYEDIQKELHEYIDTNPTYLRTLKKLDFMLRKYSQDGFTSFWI